MGSFLVKHVIQLNLNLTVLLSAFCKRRNRGSKERHDLLKATRQVRGITRTQSALSGLKALLTSATSTGVSNTHTPPPPSLTRNPRERLTGPPCTSVSGKELSGATRTPWGRLLPVFTTPEPQQGLATQDSLLERGCRGVRSSDPSGQFQGHDLRQRSWRTLEAPGTDSTAVSGSISPV